MAKIASKTSKSTRNDALYTALRRPAACNGPTASVPAPWGTSLVPEVRVDPVASFELTPAGQAYHDETGELPQGLQAAEFSAAACANYLKAHEPGIAPVELIEAGRRACMYIVCLMMALRKMPLYCPLEVAQLEMRMAELQLLMLPVAKANPKLVASKTLLSSSLSPLHNAVSSLLNAAIGLDLLGMRGTADHAAASAMLADLVQRHPESLRHKLHGPRMREQYIYLLASEMAAPLAAEPGPTGAKAA